MLKMMPVARRALGDNNETTLRLTCCLARALYKDPAATLDDLREAVSTLEDLERTARRVLGGAHPLTVEIERELQHSRKVLRTREDNSFNYSLAILAIPLVRFGVHVIANRRREERNATRRALADELRRLRDEDSSGVAARVRFAARCSM